MKKVSIDALIINKKMAGIGNFAYHLCKELDKKKEFQFEFWVQNFLAKELKHSRAEKDFTSSIDRILREQIKLPLGGYGKTDLWHFTDYASPYFPMKTPFVASIHDLTFYRYPETFSCGQRLIKQTLTPKTIARAARIIAGSENTKKDIIERFPKAERKIRVIYYDAPSYQPVTDPAAIQKVRKKYRLPEKYILAVGTLEPRKNLRRLIQAFELVKKTDPSLYLVLTGARGWLSKDLYSDIEKNNIITTGYADQDDMPALYSGAQLFVFPSLYEGFGLPPLEAMRCGVPVVVSDNSSLPEVAGEAGIYVDAQEVDSIAAGIRKGLYEEDCRAESIKKGILQSKKFSWKTSADQIIDVYREILA